MRDKLSFTIPSDWKIVQLKRIAKTTSGGTPSRSDAFNFFGNIPWFTTTELKDCELFDSLEHISEEALKKTSSVHLLEPETILLAMYGATIGKIGVLKCKAACNQACCAIHDYKCSKDFLIQLLQFMRRKIISLGCGAAQYNISQDIVKSLYIPLPSIDEQNVIAKVLTKIDYTIENVNKSIEKTELLKKALMQNLLSGKIKADGTKRSEDEIELYGKFGKKPKNWAVKPIKECFDFITNATYSRSQLTENGTCKYIHYGDIHTKFEMYLDISNEQLPCIGSELEKGFEKLRDGDLVISDTSEDYEGCVKSVELQNVGENKVIAGLHTLVLRAKTDDFINGFKELILLNNYVRSDILRMVTGIKVYSITKSSMKKVLIPIPSKPEQEEILKIFASCLDAITKKRKKIEKLNRLKRSLMQNLFTGRMRLNIDEISKILGE